MFDRLFDTRLCLSSVHGPVNSLQVSTPLDSVTNNVFTREITTKRISRSIINEPATVR